MGLSVGLDVGTHHVRAVALRGVAVAACACVPRRSDDGVERPLATVVAELAAAVPIARADAAAASELDVLARFLHIAPLPPAKLARIIRLELQSDDGPPPTIDAVRLAVVGDDLSYLGLVVDTAAVRMLQGELARGGVRPQTLSWGPVALAAAGMRHGLDGDRLALLVDIGATGTDVALVGDGRLLACRRLAVGGELFTEALAEAGLSPLQAERAKLGQIPLPEASAAAPALALDDGVALELELDDGVGLPKAPGVTTVAMGSASLGPHLTRAAEMLYGQLATTMAFFKAQLKRKELAPAQVLLCGGGAGLLALPTYLERRFQVPVERFDPFVGLTGAPEHEPWRWARAVGLALAGCGAEVPRVDLRPESELVREAWRRRLAWPWVAAACVLVSGVVLATGLSERLERDRVEAGLLERAAEEHKRLSTELTGLQSERDALREDLRAIAGRIHAARDLLYTVRALKEQTRESKELWVTSLETVGIGRDDSEAAPAPSVGGGRLIGGTRPVAPRRDSLIDRGAVDIAGRIRFDVKKTDPQMVAFRERYQQALAEWESPEGGRLFRDVRLTNTRVERGPPGTRPIVAAPPTDTGEFPFRFRAYFQHTSLDDTGAAQPADEVSTRPRRLGAGEAQP